MKVDLIRKEKKLYAEISKIHCKDESPSCESAKKGKKLLVLLLHLKLRNLQPECTISA